MKKQVYTNSFGIMTVDIYDNTYNGHTINEIETMPFTGWSIADRDMYIENCREVIYMQLSGVNLGMIECLKNTNHYIATEAMGKFFLSSSF